jgi:hypothetical protein
MSWMGNWLGNWMGSWFGLGQQQQQPSQQPAPYTRYGRVIKSAKDRLFGFQEGSWQCEISPGAVILGRTQTDDYVRFRVPDTDCPPLPQPSTPLDSGQADEAEPNRWMVTGTPNTSNKWLIKQQTDQIQLSYSCFSGDFVIEVSSDYVSKTGTCTGEIGTYSWDGVALMFDLAGKTFGIGVCWSHHFGLTEVPWSGEQAGRSYLWFVAQGSGVPLHAELIIPHAQTDVRYRVQRSGSNIRFAMLNSAGSWVYSQWLSAGPGQIQFRWEGVRVLGGGILR